MNADQEKRTRELQRISGPNLALKHVENCKVLPARDDLLALLPKGGIAAELGVAFGEFSASILERSKPRTLHLIDLWENERYIEGLHATTERFSDAIKQGSVVIHRGESVKVLENFQNGSLDFVYIDTAHSYDQTFSELCMAEKKMAPGGLIAGHDFCSGNVVAPVLYGVIQACHRFCRERDWRYKYLTLETGTSFSFCIEKIP
jgi:predicted O-methyltransferase YrrM